MAAPYIVRHPAQEFQTGAHRDIINTYPCRAGDWRCLRCRRTQPAALPRFFWHNQQRCTGGPDSFCWAGPLCHHCSESPHPHDDLIR